MHGVVHESLLVLSLELVLRQQVDTYLAATGGVADPDTLYTVWGGGNDALTPLLLATFLSSCAAAALGGIVSDLTLAGATSVMVVNLPNIGLTLVRTVTQLPLLKVTSFLSSLTMLYNKLLMVLLLP